MTEKILSDLYDAKLNRLIAEYEAWNEAQGLNLGSADEHYFDENLSDEQRKWLMDFGARWDAVDDDYRTACDAVKRLKE